MTKYTAWIPLEPFGAKLHRLRIERRLTVWMFPSVSGSTISRIENGASFNVSVLPSIAGRLDMTVSELLEQTSLSFK